MTYFVLTNSACDGTSHRTFKTREKAILAKLMKKAEKRAARATEARQ